MKTEMSLTTPQAYGALEVTTEEHYWDMLECVPPAHMSRGCFAVGEPYADRYQFGGEFDDDQAYREVFDCFYEFGSDDGKTYWLHGFFTLKDYRAVTRKQLEDAVQSATN